MLEKLTSLYLQVRYNEKGQGMVEYALIIALVAVALIGGLGLLKDGISGTFSTATGSL